MPVQQINVSPIEWQSDNLEGSTSYKQFQISCSAAPPYEQSQSSSISSTSYDICRICHCEGDSEVPLIAPCYCAGSLRYVHQGCLQQWIKSSNIRCCELCKFQFIMQTKTKPFSEWEHLEMSGFERRKLFCAVIFHAVALTCVVWSLYILIDRTAEEIQNGLLEWPFWTKLIVVAIGFTGGMVFMYIQCKAYLQICQRWKDFNRVIYVQNAPEKPSLPSPIAQIHVPSPPIVGPSQSIGAIQPTISENQLKPYQVDNQDSPSEETSIDLKNIRNLHIFFNDENRIRVQKEELESCTVDLENINNENIESNVAVPQRQDQDGHGTSWHIKIGKTKDLGSKGNDVTMSSSAHRSNDENYGGILVPAEVSRVNNGADKLTKSNDIGNSINESPILKLQIKKAEIVIKFGQKSGNCDISEDKQEEKNTNDTMNIKINNGDKHTTEPIFIDVVKNQDDERSEKDELELSNSVHMDQFNLHDDYTSQTTKLLSQSSSNENSRDITTHSWSPEKSKHNELESSSQTPLLVNNEREGFLNINKSD